MPRPPTLPTLDWESILAKGLDFEAWLAKAEFEEKRAKMEEARKTQALDPAVEAHLAALPRRVHVAAIAEDWCGDVVRHAPVLQRMADAAPNLSVRFLYREQVPEVFVRFLTNGGEAIPKFIFLSDKFVECGHWGPLPSACAERIARGKACGDVKAAREKVKQLCEADSEKRAVVSELLHLIDIASSATP
jgi:hypothetical protein